MSPKHKVKTKLVLIKADELARVTIQFAYAPAKTEAYRHRHVLLSQFKRLVAVAIPAIWKRKPPQPCYREDPSLLNIRTMRRVRQNEEETLNGVHLVAQFEYEVGDGVEPYGWEEAEDAIAALLKTEHAVRQASAGFDLLRVEKGTPDPTIFVDARLGYFLGDKMLDVIEPDVEPKLLRSTIKGCARCGEDHENLEFEQLESPHGEYDWWAPCPENGQPILLAVVEDVTKHGK